MKIAVSVLVLSCGIVTVSSVCQPGWTAFKEDCLYFGNHLSTWVSAELYCRQHGGWLMTDDNQEKHDFVRDILYVLRNFKLTKFFIGGSDVAFESQWRWIETGLNVNVHKSGYTNWGVGEPDGNNTANCLSLQWQNDTLVWADANCGSTSSGHGHNHHIHGGEAFICDKPNGNPNPGTLVG